MSLIGTSKISTDNKITLIKDVAELLDISEGDLVAFYHDDQSKDRILLKKAVIS
jgi:hypothetical protein